MIKKVLIILIFQFCLSELYSQGNLCSSCDSIPYSNETYVDLTRFCHLRVYYKFKICNGITEMKITRVDKLDTLCDGITMREIHAAMLGALLLDNPMNFSTDNWKIIRNSCWKYDNEAKMAMSPCYEGACCVTVVNTKITDCNKLQISGIKEYSNRFCQETLPNNQECFNVCDLNIFPFNNEIINH